MSVQRVGDLEISQDLDFQRRMWTIQRVGWLVIAIILLAAVVGLVGQGPLSHATARMDGIPLEVQYERVTRFKAPTTLQVRLEPGAALGGNAQLWIDRAYLEGFQIQHVLPEPQSVQVGPDRVIYTIQVNDPSQPTVVTFNLQSQQIWRTIGRVGLGDGPPVRFGQFVYP